MRIYSPIRPHVRQSAHSFLADEQTVLGIILAANGALYDPSDLTSLYQSRTGGSTGASGSVVGIMLDKSYMGGQTAAAFIAGQAELVTNPGPFTATTGWTAGNASQTTSGGNIILTASGAGAAYTSQTLSGLTAGRWYRVTGSCTRLDGNSASARWVIYDTPPTTSSLGSVCISTGSLSSDTFLFQATDTSVAITAILVSAAGAGAQGSFGAVSVKAIPGFHALAPSDVARPLLTVSGGLAYLTADGVDDWMNVTPTLSLGEAWWHVGGWLSSVIGGALFATSNQANNRSAPDEIATALRWVNSALSRANIATVANTAAAHVNTIEQTATASISGRINGVVGSTITPFDDSASTQGLALFNGRNDALQANLSGRFYGGAFAPGTISTTDRATLESYVAALSGVTL